MSYNWSWEHKTAEMELVGTNKKTYKLIGYQGNGVMIWLYEDEKNNTYEITSFFVDIEHMKRCLGLVKGYDSIFYDKVKRLTINKKESRYYKQIITAYAQAFKEIEIKVISKW